MDAKTKYEKGLITLVSALEQALVDDGKEFVGDLDGSNRLLVALHDFERLVPFGLEVDLVESVVRTTSSSNHN